MSTSVTRLFGLEGGAWMRHATPDRRVLLFEDMKTRDPEYASWDY